MFFGRRNWIKSLRRRSTSPSRRRLQLLGIAKAQSPAIELLEDRTLLSNFSIADVTVAETDADSINFFFTVTRDNNAAEEINDLVQRCIH